MAFTFTSYGAAEEVTGTKHLLEYNGVRVLLDCGMFQGKREESDAKNRHFGFDPASLDAVFLSHAHIDHSGLLPRLVKEGFAGPIFCTSATKELITIMLKDSARIQEADAEYFAEHTEIKTPISKEPLYTEEDVEVCLKQVQEFPVHVKTPFKNMQVTFYPAGHVIGSVLLKFECGEKSLLFSGDLGRSNMPILIDREMGLIADIIVCESTYGGKTHEPITLSSEELTNIIAATMERGGKVIIPSFALERTQEILYYLEEAFTHKGLMRVPVYIDSPMGIDITKVFQDHSEWYDDEMKDRYKKTIPFQLENMVYTKSTDDSKMINSYRFPCIIIAGSGMCEAGRVRHHLKNGIEDFRNTVLVVGYMAENTLGRRLIEGAPLVTIFGQTYNVRASIHKLNSFSGHADEPDILSWLESIRGKKRLILVHGEPNAQSILKSDAEKLIEQVDIAKFGEMIEL